MAASVVVKIPLRGVPVILLALLVTVTVMCLTPGFVQLFTTGHF